MVVEFRRRGHVVEIQREFPVFYRNEMIGHLTPDLIVTTKLL
jgi:PD-(D/E)XK nuclease superfamily